MVCIARGGRQNHCSLSLSLSVCRQEESALWKLQLIDFVISLGRRGSLSNVFFFLKVLISRNAAGNTNIIVSFVDTSSQTGQLAPCSDSL